MTPAEWEALDGSLLRMLRNAGLVVNAATLNRSADGFFTEHDTASQAGRLANIMALWGHRSVMLQDPDLGWVVDVTVDARQLSLYAAKIVTPKAAGKKLLVAHGELVEVTKSVTTEDKQG